MNMLINIRVSKLIFFLIHFFLHKLYNKKQKNVTCRRKDSDFTCYGFWDSIHKSAQNLEDKTFKKENINNTYKTDIVRKKTKKTYRFDFLRVREKCRTHSSLCEMYAIQQKK